METTADDERTHKKSKKRERERRGKNRAKRVIKPQVELLGGNSTTPILRRVSKTVLCMLRSNQVVKTQTHYSETHLKIVVVHASKQPSGNSTKTRF